MADRQKIKQIHDNTDFKTEFAGITQDGEFIYDQHGGRVRAGLEYHVHYTNDKQEFYMLGGTHNPDSKIIVKVGGVRTLFSKYNSLKSSTKQEYPSITPGYPSDSDYNIGSFTRYFTQSLTRSGSPVFEISKKDFQTKNDLFRYVSINWKITGTRPEVYRVNEISTRNANEELRGVSDVVFPLQFWRAPKNSPTTLAKKLNLLR